MIGGVALLAVVAGTVAPQMMAPPAPVSGATVTVSKNEQGKLTYTPPVLPDDAGPGAMLWRLVLGTAAALAICVGTLWAGKRWLTGPSRLDSLGRQMSLVETLPIGNRCCVHLLKVGDRPVLVGVDASGVKTMVALPESFAETLAGLGAGQSLPQAAMDPSAEGGVA